MEEREDLKFLQALRDGRKRIDAIDRKLLSLLNQRLRIALSIGEVKKKMGQAIYDAKREEEVLERLIQRNKGPLKAEALKRIFRTIMSICRKAQS